MSADGAGAGSVEPVLEALPMKNVTARLDPSHSCARVGKILQTDGTSGLFAKHFVIRLDVLGLSLQRAFGRCLACVKHTPSHHYTKDPRNANHVDIEKDCEGQVDGYVDLHGLEQASSLVSASAGTAL